MFQKAPSEVENDDFILGDLDIYALFLQQSRWEYPIKIYSVEKRLNEV
jgi:hypothetical protein